MRDVTILTIIIFLTGCTASVTYYKPSGPGELLGNCNTPLHLLSYPVTDGVEFSILSYPSKDTNGVYVSGNLEVSADNVVTLLSPVFTLESIPDRQTTTVNIDKLTSKYVLFDEEGKVEKVEEREFMTTDSLIGHTYRDSGFWGSVHGDYYQRFTFSFTVNNYDKKAFRVLPPDLLINDKKVSLSAVEFYLTTKTILLSPCP